MANSNISEQGGRFNFNTDWSNALGPTEALRLAFSRLGDTTRRSRRSEFSWFILVASIAGCIVGALVSPIPFFGPVFGYLAGLIPILVTFPCGIRRMHDIGYTGMWYLLSFIPGVNVIFWIVLVLADSQPDTNNWGKNPKN